MGINYFPQLPSQPLSQKPCVCKPSCSTLRAQDVLTQVSHILPAEVACTARSQAVGNHKSANNCYEVIRLKENPWWVLQENYKLQPGLSQAVYQQPQLLIHSLPGSWAKTPGLPLPTAYRAKGSTEDSWSGHALFPRRGIKCALTKFPFQFSSLETEVDLKWDLKCPFYILRRINRLATDMSVFLVKLW